MPITDAMRNRHAVRSYEDAPIPQGIVDRLRERLAEENARFGTDIRLVLDDADAFGFFLRIVRAHGVRNYFVLTGDDVPDLDERLGLAGAGLMLFAKELGLDSWWVGGTFSKQGAAKASGATGPVRAVLTIGFGRTHGEPHSSRAASEVAIYEGEAPAWFEEGVEAALLAPTAMGAQHFRIEGRGRRVSITCPESPYSGQDLGIVERFFALGAGEENFDWARPLPD